MFCLEKQQLFKHTGVADGSNETEVFLDGDKEAVYAKVIQMQSLCYP